MSVSARLEQLGVVLPQVVAPLAAYVPALRTGNLVYTAGQLPIEGGKLARTGLGGTGPEPAPPQSASNRIIARQVARRITLSA